MGKFTKVIIGLLVLIAVTVIALVLVVRFTLTDDRIRTMVIPQAEKALGRTVMIGDIDVSVFKGITIKDFTVKEEDGQNTFIGAGAFVLRYDLMPLLQKKFVVNELILQNPSINIHRSSDGKFNFDSLALLQDASTSKPPPDTSKKTSAALPVALTVNSIRIENASLTVRDDLGEIPSADVTINLTLSVDLSGGIASLNYTGDMDLIADIVHGELKPHIKATGNFDNKNVGMTLDLTLDKEHIRLDNKITNYMNNPDIQVDVFSENLNIDNLLALTAGLPKAEPDSTPPSEIQTDTPKKPLSEALPPGLSAHGKVQVDKAIFKKLPVTDFGLQYSLKDGKFTVQGLTAKAAGGELSGNVVLDLTRQEPAYTGDIKIRAMQLTELGSGLIKDFTEVISGALETAVTFDGAGTEWEHISKVLTADATYALSNGKISSTPTTTAISDLVGLQELKEIDFQDITGKLLLAKGGKINLSSELNSEKVGIETSGAMDINGKLDLPITLKLSPELTEKLGSNASITKFLANEKGETVLRLKLAGTLKDPKPTLDSAGVQEQVVETVKTKAFEELGKALSEKEEKNGSSSTEPAINLLKGLFGQ